MIKFEKLKILFQNNLHPFSAAVHFEANPDAKRLYDDLLSNYNRLIRPVVNNTETLTVWIGLKVTQILEVSLRNQVMTTNLWQVYQKIIFFIFLLQSIHVISFGCFWILCIILSFE